MNKNTPYKINIKPDGTLFLWLLAFICLIPWAIIQSQSSINSNTAWLTLCAERILDGGSMSQDCYDTNPPLSVLIHTPPVILEKITGIASYYWIFILSLSIALAGSVLTQYFLNKLKWAEPHQAAILSITIFAMLTIEPGSSFADRDHLIAMIFIPFTLCQICLTQRIRVHKFLEYFTFLLGTVFILLKPFYGFFPTLILLHRIINNRSIKPLHNKDFIILLSVTIFYIALTFIFFNDYVFSIAPYVLKLYSPYTRYEIIWPECKILLTILMLCITFYILLIKDKQYSLLLLLTLCTLNGLLAFILQCKGFFYHLLPAHTALAAIIMLLILGMIKSFSTEKIANNFIVNCFCVLIIFMLSYAQKPPNIEYPTHQQYQNNIFTQTIDRYCDKDCSYLMTYENMDIVSQIAYYYPAQYASRFPTFWFCPMIELKLENKDVTAENASQETKDFYAIKLKHFGFIAQDIKRFSPSILLIMQSDMCSFNVEGRAHEIINTYMADYKKIDTIEIDRAIFYKKTKYDFPYPLKWDVYLRKNAQYFKVLEKQ